MIPGRRRRDDLLILGYHAVSERWGAEFSTTPERFRRQLEIALQRGYTPVTLSDARSSGGKRLVVTFDDGYRSVGDVAAPVMRELGVPGTVFVVTDLVECGGPLDWPAVRRWHGTPDEHELLPLGWDRLRELDGEGWEIGSHTATHPRLTKLGRAEVREELARSKEHVERELGACTSFCAPFGFVDEVVLEEAASCGYAVGCNSLPVASGNPLNLPRVGISRADTVAVYRAKISQGGRFLRNGGGRTLGAPLRAAYGVVRKALSET
jgi:peptidoglycan/xylan/chitin deacetylase (PgdA/CDA1 family)